MMNNSVIPEPQNEEGADSHIVAIDVAVNKTFDALTNAAMRTPVASEKISTGFRDVDGAIGGLYPGELVIVSGSTATGKSSFVLNVALNAARSDVPVLILSPGSTEIDVATRLLAFEGNLNPQSLARGSVSSTDWESLADAANKISALNIRICCEPWPTTHDVAKAAKETFQDAEKALIVFDGLEWMGPQDTPCGLYNAGWAAFQLKALTKALGACTIATMAPSPKSDPAKTWSETLNPKECLSSLLGAENAADVVLLLDKEIDNQAHLILAKSKRTPLTSVPLVYVPERGRFVDFADDARNPNKRHDNRVGEIALNLGMSREDVADALNSMYEDD